MVWRSAGAIAAAVLLTGTGVVVTSALNGEGNRFHWLWDQSEPERVASNLKQLGTAMAMYSGPVGDQARRYYHAGTAMDTQPPEAGSASNFSDIGTDRTAQPQSARTPGAPPFDQYDSVKYPRFARAADAKSRSAGETTDAGSTRFGYSRPPTVGIEPDAPTLKGAGVADADHPFQPSQLGPAYVQALGVPTAPDAPNKTAVASARSAPASSVNGQNGVAADPANPPVQSLPASGRKVIRNGAMEFEVDRFDDALVRVTKLVTEQEGFVATTDSDKLANGKMQGTVTLRVPPDRMDTLVLSLRALGDLKSQKITAEDVTKHYTDLEGALRADRAMEDRLLAIIKTGTGAIKDLLAAEKELAEWREKIEQIEGEKRYLDAQVSLSTLVLTLTEKDIKLPASASETEQVNLSLETEKVDQAYDSALEVVKAAKGRILQSELEQYDAGQFGATLTAAVPPDASEQVIARFRQLSGRIAHFEREHKQATTDGGAVRADVVHVQQEDTIVNLQIYNLTNVAPRRTTNMRVAVADVDKAYQRIIDQVRSLGGRVVTSSLARPDANSQSAELNLQIPVERADVLVDALNGSGEVMRQESTENPDTANVTETKRGFRVSMVSLAAVTPREIQVLQVAAANVPQAFEDILGAVRAGGGRVLQSDLNEQNLQDVAGTLAFEIPRSAFPQINAAIDKTAQVLSRTVNRSSNIENTVDTKLRLQMSLMSADRLSPRQTTTIREEVAEVERAVDDIVVAATAAGGHRLPAGDLTQDRSGNVTGRVIVEVPLNKAGPILDQIERMGNRRSKEMAYDSSVPDGSLARARFDVTFSNSAASLGGEETTGDAIRNGLTVSGKGLRWSLQMLVVGFCFVAPWALVLWLIGKLIRRSRSKVKKAEAA